MAYADTSFFVGFVNEKDEHYESAVQIQKRFKNNIETSLLTLTELMIGCKKQNADPEILIGSVFKIAKISGISFEEAMQAAHYMKHKGLDPFDALHCALAGDEIISADKDFDKTGVKRIWAEKSD